MGKISKFALIGACAGMLYGYVTGVYHLNQALGLEDSELWSKAEVKKVSVLEDEIDKVQRELDRNVPLKQIRNPDLTEKYQMFTKRLEELQRKYNGLIADPEINEMKSELDRMINEFERHAYHTQISSLIMLVSLIPFILGGYYYLDEKFKQEEIKESLIKK